MEKGKRYLISTKDKDALREWECLEVAESAFKVQDLVTTSSDSWVLTSSRKVNDPFWVLKSDIDKLGNTRYRILEELK